jgi:hypothetical protein
VAYDSTLLMRIRPQLWHALALATVACSSSGDGSAPAGPGAGGGAGAGNDASSGDTGGTIPTPSHDWRVDTSDNCISIAGTYNGKAIDLFCNATNDIGVAITQGKWVIGCRNLNPGLALLNVPIQKPGSIAETATAGSKPQMAFQFSADTSSSVAMFTNNLVRADLAGTIVVDSFPSYRLVSGTLQGTWATPDSSCLGPSGSLCAPANLNVIFRLRSRYGNCLSDADCMPPQICRPVSYDCAEARQ